MGLCGACAHCRRVKAGAAKSARIRNRAGGAAGARKGCKIHSLRFGCGQALPNRLRVHKYHPMSGDPFDDGPGGDGEDDALTGVRSKTLTRTKKPSLYRVLILNDDYTPMEFVVYVLERFFNKSRDEATQIMLHVHQNGVGVCGIFTYEVAETKVAQVLDLARRNEHPLQCTMEKE
jgi:ATP-dependent Clp protease adaptor protein ClpS